MSKIVESLNDSDRKWFLRLVAFGSCGFIGLAAYSTWLRQTTTNELLLFILAVCVINAILNEVLPQTKENN